MAAITLSIEEALARAGRAWRDGDAAHTLTICEAILARSPQNVDALNLLGLSLFALERKAEAKDALLSAVAIESRADLHNNLALIHKSLDDIDRAMDHYAIALRLKSDYGEAHANLGRLLLHEGNGGGSIKHLRKALDLGWHHPNVHGDLAVLSMDRNDPESALDHLTQWLLLEMPMLTRLADPTPLVTPAKDLPFAAALLALADELERAGLPFFLGDGTALGCVRDHDFIAYDKDIDLGMHDDVPRERVLAVLDAASDFWIDVATQRAKSDLVITAYYRQSVAIDIFFYKRHGGHVVHGLSWGGHSILWRQSPFAVEPVLFLGRRFQIPAPADRYLAELYGAGWREPDPDYCAFVSGDIFDTLPLLGRLHALHALQRAIKDGKRSRALAIGHGLLTRLPEGPVDQALRSALAGFVEKHAR